jgi:hypothetical protein
MLDLTHPRLIQLKGLLFLLLGPLAAVLLLLDAPSLRNTVLLGIVIWSFCRAYYFAFYVIEHYVDPSFRSAGLSSALRHPLRRPQR